MESELREPKNIIYGLYDPRTNELRYIGKSTFGLKRPRQHFANSVVYGAESHTHKSRWIKILKALGLEPRVEVLDWLEEPTRLCDLEREYIARHRAMGARLTNITDGGDGPHGYKRTPEHCRNISLAKKGVKMSLATRQKMSDAHKGRVSPNLGRKWPDEYKRKMALSHNMRPFQDQKGNVYQTLAEASAILGLHKTSISRVLHGKHKQVKGYVFSFMEIEQ